MRHLRYIAELLVLGLLANWVPAQGQTVPPEPPTPAAQAPAEGLQPETVEAYRNAIQAELETVVKSNLTQEELEKARTPYDDMLRLLAALDAAWQRQLMYTTQLAQLQVRFREVTESAEKLETRPLEQFDTVTEDLRDQYEAHVQATQNEIQEILKQTSAGEARLVAIPKELEQYTIKRQQLTKRLEEVGHAKLLHGQGASLVSDAARLAVELQVLDADIQALSAEQQWLVKRGALQDALLKAAQTRLKRFQEELEAIQETLGSTIDAYQATLDSEATALEHALQDTTAPIERHLIDEQLRTLQARQQTAAYRQQLNQLSHAVLAEVKRKASLQRDVDRLTSLFEKYSSGSSGGQRLLLAFERLRRERERFREQSIADIEAQLRLLTEQMFDLEDRLYDFDQQVESSLAQMQPAFQRASTSLQAKLRQAFNAQKAALREQYQVLARLVQEKNNLLALHRERQRLLSDSYYVALSKMLWLRNSAPLNLEVLRQSLAGAIHVLARLGVFLQTVSQHLMARAIGAAHLWGLAMALFVLLPLGVYRLQRGLRERVKTSLAACRHADVRPGLFEASVIALRSALWPAYLAFVVWYYVQFLPEGTDPFGLVLGRSLLFAALILWLGLLGYDILRRNGWGEQCWQLRPECCRFLRPIFSVACLAALMFVVPRYLVLNAPAVMASTAPTSALARLLLLCFQAIVLVLLALAGWRNSPAMDTILPNSRQQEGLWWRLWPSIYGLMLAGITGIMVLDSMGYRYASQFIWLRTLESAFVLLLRRLLVVLLLLRLLHYLVDYVFSRSYFKRYPAAQETIDRTFDWAYRAGSVLLLLLAAGAILEIWGISATWLITSSMGVTVLTRMTIIAAVIGLAIVIIQVSKAVTEYVLQPKANAPQARNVTYRKFNTMIPLIHTLLKVGVIFVAVLVVLEQLNIATGPILTGVGIFGLAVGFASQSLIKDVINGLFILFEDSLSVGDVVTLRGTGGVVEKVTLRAVTIRDLSGNVHVIPNSTLDMITNLTKDYGRYVIDVGVAYREDVDAVMAILREVDAEIFRDPDFGWDMLEPLEIMGLQDFADSALIIRTRLKTRPGQQWRVMREYRRRIKQAFDAHGIEIPFPHRTVYWGVPKTGEQSLPVSLYPAQMPRTENGAAAEGKPVYHDKIEDRRDAF